MPDQVGRAVRVNAQAAYAVVVNVVRTFDVGGWADGRLWVVGEIVEFLDVLELLLVCCCWQAG